MAFNHTEESLKSMLKPQLIELVLHLQKHTTETINKLTNEIKKINETFSKLEADINITKNVNTKLTEQLVETERQCWANAQYSRRECLEIVGIPSTVENDDLEEKVCEIFQKIGVSVTEADMEACHRLKGNKTIVKFSRRKLCHEVLRKKKNLKKFKLSDVGLSGETPLFINESLCAYYKGLWNRCKELWNEKRIYSYFTVNGIVKYTLREGGEAFTVTHKNDLKEKFPVYRE